MDTDNNNTEFSLCTGLCVKHLIALILDPYTIRVV